MRNYSPQAMFLQMALKHEPQCKFQATDIDSFLTWKNNTIPKVLATLGKSPPKAAPNPHFIGTWEHDGLKKERWIIDVNPYLSATCAINYPPDFVKEGKTPAILICAGHSRVAGHKHRMGTNVDDPKDPVSLQAYGHHMAKSGFVTFAIDWLAIGDNNDSNKPNNKNQDHGRDWCNLYYLHATLLGMTTLSINIASARAAIDFITALPGIDGQNVGVMGSSGGGAMALWVSLCEERIQATEIICYSDLFTHFGIRDTAYCGMQITPGLFDLVDVPDLQGLMAPRPLLVDIGACDECFRLESAMECFHRLEKIYKCADAENMLELDFHHGGHHWGGNKSEAFFKKFL